MNEANIDKTEGRNREQHNIRRGFHAPTSVTDKTTREKIREKQLNHKYYGQMGLPDVPLTLHPATAEDTFFSTAHRPFSRTDHLQDRPPVKPQNKFKKTETIRSIFSDHSGRKLEINNKRKTYVEIK